MFSVILSWLAMFVMTSSVGWLSISGLSCATKSLSPRHLDIFHVFWIGLATVIAFAQIFSLFVPLNSTVLVLWFVAALSGSGLAVRWIRTETSSRNGREPVADLWRRGIFVLGAILAIYVAASGVSTLSWSGDYDTDLYHFNALRWMNEYAAVPGLGNLHSRLGMTSGFLVISALLDNLWWDGHTAWLTYGFIVVMTCIHWLSIIVFPSRDGTVRRRLFCLLTSPYLAALVTATRPTLYYDDIALLIQMVFFAELLRTVQPFPERAEDPGRYPRRGVTDLTVLAATAVLGFSIKPMGILPLVFTTLLVVAVLLVHAVRHRVGLRLAAKSVFAIFAIVGLVLAGHFSRNVILTGWLFYPTPIGNTRAEWAMPEEPGGSSHAEEVQSVAGLYRVIQAWARLPGPAYRNAISGGYSSWFPGWRQRVWRGIEPRLLFAGTLLVFVHLLWLTASRARRNQEAIWDVLLIGLAAANLLFWFLTAPDLRFGRAFFWIWMGLGGCMVLSKATTKPVVSFSLAGIAVACLFNAAPVHYSPQSNLTSWQVGHASPAATKETLLDNDQVPPLRLFIPESGDQCGDSALPCTPYPFNSLRSRTPGNLGAGFKSIPAR